MQARTKLVAAAAAGLAIYLAAPAVTGRSWDTMLGDLSGLGRGLVENTARAPTGNAPAPGAPTPAAVVTISQPLRREIVEWDEAVGRFDAMETVDLRARVNGYLQEVLFKDGQDVAKGDTLFVIDPRPYERALAQAQAELEQARTRIANARDRKSVV